MRGIVRRTARTGRIGRRKVLGTLAAAVGLMAVMPLAASPAMADPVLPGVVVAPVTVQAGTVNDHTISVVASQDGASSLRADSMIRIEFPRTFTPPQLTDPVAPGYVSANPSAQCTSVTLSSVTGGGSAPWTVVGTASDCTGGIVALSFDYTSVTAPSATSVALFRVQLGYEDSVSVFNPEGLRIVNGAAGADGDGKVYVTAAPAVSLRVGLTPASGLAGSLWTPTVKAVDSLGNVDTTATGLVTFASTDPGSSAFVPPPTPLVDGQATVPGGIRFTTAGVPTVTAAVGSLSGTARAKVRPGPAETIQVTAPSTVKVASPFSVTATARDEFGNVASGYLGSVGLGSTDPASLLVPPITFTALDLGKRTITGLELGTLGTQQISVTDLTTPSITGSASISAIVGNVHHLGVDVAGATVTGRPNDVLVTAYDELGNVVPGYRGAVRFTSGPGSARLPNTYRFTADDAGVRLFEDAPEDGAKVSSAFFLDDGVQTLTVTDTANPAITGQATVSVGEPGELAGFEVEAPSLVTAGDRSTFTILPVDVFGNPLHRYAGTVEITLATPDPRVPVILTYTFSGDLFAGGLRAGGLAKGVDIRLTKAGEQTIQVRQVGPGSQPSGSDTLTVRPATAVKMDIQPTSALPEVSGRKVVVANAPVDLRFTALDLFGNRVTDYQGIASVTAAGEPGVPPSIIFNTLAQGQVIVPVALQTTGDLDLSVSASRFPVPPPTDTRPPLAGKLPLRVLQDLRLEISGIAEAQRDVAAGFTVRVRDGVTGDIATGYRGTVTFSSGDAGATLPAAYTFTSGDAGQKTFAPGVTFSADGPQDLTVTDTARPSVTETTTVDVVSHGPVASFDVTTVASTPAGQANSVVVTARDANGRQVLDFAGDVTWSSSDPGATLPGTSTFAPSDHGRRTFAGVTLIQAGTQTVAVAASSDPAVSGSASVSVSPLLASTFQVALDAPATVDSSNRFVTRAGTSVPMVVTAVDRFGNRALTFTGSASVSAAGETLLPPSIDFQASDGGQRTIPVVLTRAGSRPLTVTSPRTNSQGTIVSGRTSVVVTAAVPASIADRPLSPTRRGVKTLVPLTFRDAFGNPVVAPYTATPAEGQGVEVTSSDPLAEVPSGLQPLTSYYKVKFGTGGTQTVTLTATLLVDPATGATVTLPARTLSFTVNDPVTASLEVTAPSSVLPGESFDLTVTARNADGSVDTAYGGTVTVTTDDPDPATVVPAPFGIQPNFDAGTRTMPDSVTLRTGGTRTISISGTNGSGPALVGQTTIRVGPDNDDFAAAEVLSGSSGSVDGTSVGATSEEDEPGIGYSDLPVSVPTVWYRWVAPQAGGVNLDTCTGTNYDSTVAVYTGSTLATLNEVASGDDGCGLRTRLSFTATQGQEYWIQVSGYEGESGTFQLHWETILGPDNDDLADAQVVTGVAGTVDGTTVGATAEAGEPHYWLAGSAEHSVWYSWVSPKTAMVNIDTCLNPTFDSTIGVYTGETIESLDQVASEDIDYWGTCGGPDGPAVTEFSATAGQQYWFQVDGRFGEVGTFTLRWSTSGLAPNDDFADASVISGTSGSVLGKTFLAGVESGEPLRAGGAQGTVWYEWTPTSSGSASFTTCANPNTSMVITIFTGSSLGGLSEVARTTLPCGEEIEYATFEAVAGETYLIQADGIDEFSRGFFWLDWQQTIAE